MQGSFDAAIAAFRTSLALDPTLLAARRELAHTLLLVGQFDVAEFHFETLLEIDPDPTRQDAYRRFLTVISRNKPFGVTGHFAILPSTNVNRGTTNTVFDTTSATFIIDPNSRAASGMGVQLGVSGFARFNASQTSRWTLAGSLTGTGYGNEIHNTATVAVSLTYDKSFDRGRWSLGPYARSTWREDDADNRQLGLQFAMSYRLTQRVSFGVVAQHEERSYPYESYKDGPYDKLTLSLARQIDPSLVLRASVSVEQARPDARHLQYDGVVIGATLSKAWDGGWTTAFGLDLGARDFVGNYPLTTSPRNDEFASLSISLHNPAINFRGFTPRLRCAHTANRSNVAFYDYNTTECQATLSTDF